MLSRSYLVLVSFASVRIMNMYTMALQSILRAFATALCFCMTIGARAGFIPRGEDARLTYTTFTYGTFSFTSMPSVRYATPLKSPLALPTPFGPPFSNVSALLESNITYITYSLNPNATAANYGLYNQSAYAVLRPRANYTWTNNPPLTTTVSPTPVASTELVFPPTIPLHQLIRARRMDRLYLPTLSGEPPVVPGRLNVVYKLKAENPVFWTCLEACHQPITIPTLTLCSTIIISRISNV